MQKKSKNNYELLITHKVEDTKVFIDSRLDQQIKGDYILLGEFCEYNNVTFVINFNSDDNKTIAFEECKFNNCKFLAMSGISLEFNTCELKNTELEPYDFILRYSTLNDKYYTILSQNEIGE